MSVRLDRLFVGPRLWDGPEDLCRRVRHYGYGESYVRLVEVLAPNRRSTCLLFVHGRFGCAPIWMPLIHRLRSEWECAVPDLPGFGRSFVASGRSLSFAEHVSLLVRLIDRMDRDAVLVGHDIGGALAQAAGILRPQRIRALVLVNPTCVTEALPEVRPRLVRRLLRAARTRRPRGSTLSRDQEEAWNSAFEGWGIAAARSRLRQSVRAVHLSWPGEIHRLQLKRDVHESDCPALIVRGLEDPLHDPDQTFRLVRLMKHSDFAEIESCSLWPSVEAPVELALLVRQFLFRAGIGEHEPGISLGRRSLSR